MKKIGLLLSCFILLSAFTCDNEPLEGDFDDGELITDPTLSIIGEWELVSFDVEMNNSTEFEGNTTETNLLVDSFNSDYNLVLTDNNTFTTNGSYSYNTEITISGQEAINDSYDLENVSGSGTYITEGNQITTNGSFFEFTFEGIDDSILDNESQTAIYVLTNSGNTLTFVQNETTTINNAGATIIATTVSTSIWSRVSQQNNPCDDAITAANEAETTYNNDDTNTTLCNAYITALESQIIACGDADGSIQSIIDSIDCQANGVSLIGTWRIVSLTSNGVEELQDELDISGLCYWHEVITETTTTDIEYSGDNCEDEFIADELPYELNGNIITVDGDADDTLEIIELTSTTLKYRDVYLDDDNVEFEDVYTFERQ